ncbi:hypothetical protein G7046_g1405 [Stylonectria norvegica]|nr:hypothetical protein G7046_g1405 [Stylonectria norvegica]
MVWRHTVRSLSDAVERQPVLTLTVGGLRGGGVAGLATRLNTVRTTRVVSAWHRIDDPVALSLSLVLSFASSPQPLRPKRPDLEARLIKREPLTPTISRFTFRLDGVRPAWRAGQYVTLDFEPELGAGYAHMRDDDPQSLNDDYVRTFTVSSAPGSGDMQITARRHGPATAFLWKHNLRVPLDLPVLGFGGSDSFHISLDAAAPSPVFVAAGVGITPLLAQAPGLFGAGVRMKLLWSVRAEDMGLVEDTMKKIPELAGVTTLFLTGGGDENAVVGVEVERRRIEEADVVALNGEGRKFFLCTGPGMLKTVSTWLEGEDVVWEDFGY